MTQQPGNTPAHRGAPTYESDPGERVDQTRPVQQPQDTQDTQGTQQTQQPQDVRAVREAPAPAPSRREERAARRSRRHDGDRDLGGAHDRDGDVDRDRRDTVTDPARDKFGGVNLGACFFGWIVAIGVTVLLAGIVGAIITAVGSETGITQSDAQRQSGTIGLATAIVLLVVLALGYYAGGYVAGRMSRFDGGRQGIAVWVLGLVVTLVAIGLGALFGDQYNVLDRVDLPRVYLSDEQLGWGTAITAAAVLVVTLLAAWIGGVVGRRYHHRVDRVAGRAWEDAAAGR